MTAASTNDSQARQQIDLLAFKVFRGLAAYGVDQDPAYVERAKFELGVIARMGFAPYFLIVADLCRFMRDQNIRYVVRGSGCSSVCVWALAISHHWLDPLKWQLPFERFLNPDRISNPDLDMDIDDLRRGAVMQYSMDKYGADHVARLCTFGTLKPKAAIIDTARALDLPDYQKLSAEISNYIPPGPNVTLDKALAASADLRAMQARFPQLFAIARRLEGKARQAGVHAAGTIIAPGPITDYLPAYYRKSPDSRTEEENFPATQWDMYDAEKRGLLKMDYLALTTLRVIEQAQFLIRRLYQPDFNIDQIPLDDPGTWSMLARGELAGVFQIERPYVRAFAQRMDLKRMEPWDLAVLVAIIRPGMLDAGMTEVFLKRASGDEPPDPPHPLLADTLKKTYGVMVFQEDLMRACRDMAGFTMSQADEVRKGVGKKKPKILAKMKPLFVKGAVAKGATRDQADYVWSLMETFGRYGFCLGHASAYGMVVAYQTAYLKANYPLPYLTCLINSESGKTSKEDGYNFKVADYVEEARRLGIHVLQPCVQRSRAICKLDPRKNEIRFGLSLVKGLSESSARWITSPAGQAAACGGGGFKDFVRACIEVRPTGQKRTVVRQGRKIETQDDEYKPYVLVSRAEIETLIWCGAMDCYLDGDLGRRPHLVAMLPELLKLTEKYHNTTAKITSGGKPRHTPDEWLDLIHRYQPDEDALPELPLDTLLEKERQLTGCFLSCSPFTSFVHLHHQQQLLTPADLEDQDPPYEKAVIMALTRNVRVKVVKQGKSKGRSMAILDLAGLAGDITVPIFPAAYEQAGRVMPVERAKVYLVNLAKDQRKPGYFCTGLTRLSDCQAPSQIPTRS